MMVNKSDISSMRRNGFAVLNKHVSGAALYEFFYWNNAKSRPVRGHLKSGEYSTQPGLDQDWANYWSETTRDTSTVNTLRKDILDETAAEFLNHPVMYDSSVSVIMPMAGKINPHVDTPYRHPPWNLTDEKKMLGLQMAIPLQSYAANSGTTGFLPSSQARHWPIKDCYKGKFNTQFMKNVYQPYVDFGDVLIWDARTLHSQMPNQTMNPRYMLLLNYIEDSIVDAVADYEVSQSF